MRTLKILSTACLALATAQVYDVRTDRYSIPFALEFPIDGYYSNDQAPGE